jgi:sugar (pentulose or hexulose) kinase
MDLVAGLDVATADVRAMVVDATGAVFAEASAALPHPVTPRAGWVEQDPSAWWPAAASALRNANDGLGGFSRSVVAVAVCATSGTVVVTDRDGIPSGPALLYSDQRATQEAAVAQAAGEARWRRLGLHVQPSFGLPKAGWLVREHRDAARLAHVSDVVVERLIGRPAPTDWSHALKSGYDPERREWATEALEALGIPADLMPQVLQPTELAGEVTPAAAGDTGLPVGCQVRLGMTDACASQLAAGASEPGQFVSVLGSTLAIKGVSRDLVVDPAGAVYSHRHPDGWWMPGGASSTGAGILHQEFAGLDLGELDDHAARRGPAAAVTYPLVGRGERFPFSFPDAEGFWLGEPVDQTERYRAILEGVAFVERLAMERLTSMGCDVRPPLSLAGGGSRSGVWNSIRATVLRQPVIAKPAATTALGACILAAAGTIHPDLASATRCMSVSGDQVEPDEGADARALGDNYERLVAALTERGWLDW